MTSRTEQRRQKKYPTRLGISLAAIAAVIGLVGCTSEPMFEGPWSAEFEERYAQATSDFVRQVLEDGQITSEEYDETSGRYAKCMEDRGYSVSITQLDGLNTYSYVSAPGADSASDDCSTELSSIETLYGAMLGNPDNRDPIELYAECFVRHGFAETGFTREDFLTWMENTSGGGTTPSGVPVSDPRVGTCLTDPSQ